MRGFPSCYRAGSTPTMCRKLCTLRTRRASTCRRAWSVRRVKRIRIKSRRSFGPHVRRRRSSLRHLSSWEVVYRAAGQVTDPRMTVQRPNSFRTGPDERGHFGIYGGRFVAETLMPLILELEQAYTQAKADPPSRRRWTAILQTMSVGRRRFILLERLTEHCGGAKIYFKRESSTTPARIR